MSNEYAYTKADYIKFIAEILEEIEDSSYIPKIYSIVYSKLKSERIERRKNA